MWTRIRLVWGLGLMQLCILRQINLLVWTLGVPGNHLTSQLVRMSCVAATIVSPHHATSTIRLRVCYQNTSVWVHSLCDSLWCTISRIHRLYMKCIMKNNNNILLVKILVSRKWFILTRSIASFGNILSEIMHATISKRTRGSCMASMAHAWYWLAWHSIAPCWHSKVNVPSAFVCVCSIIDS